MVLAIGALLAAFASPPASSAGTPYIGIRAATAGRVKITLTRHVPRGRVDFVLDGHRIRRTRHHSITVFLPRGRANAAWHRIAVRRTGAKRLLARARFAMGTSSSRRAPTLVLLGAPSANNTGTTAVLSFDATTKTLFCSLDGEPYKPCKSPVSYTNLVPGTHKFTVRARGGKRGSTVTVNSTIVGPPLPSPNPNGRKLVFEDDFNGNAVNAANWSLYNSPGHAGNGLRRPSAFTTDGQGHLVITAQTIDGKIVSGGMSNRLNQTYGLYEFRVRTDPDPTGTMSGVVLTWPTSGKWPQDGENDIYETGTRANTRSPFGSFVHFGQHNDQRAHLHNADAAQWHTMAMDWSPRAIKVYRDGVLAWTVTNPNAIPKVAHHLCVQLDAFANRQLATPVRMYVDWVRIYQ
jgi:Glycosyl hydrolases family 16